MHTRTDFILDKPALYAPHDANDIGYDHRGMMFTADGNIVFVPFGTQNGDGSWNDGTAVTIEVLAGVLYPFRAKRLNATNHTAGTVTIWRK
jgi:hypothetical protein